MDQGKIIQFPRLGHCGDRLEVGLLLRCEEGRLEYEITGVSESSSDIRSLALCLEAVAQSLRKKTS